jgi:zinc transport system substrate-binding protein
MACTLLFAALLFNGCGDRRELDEPGEGRLSIFVTNYPLQYLAERIGGDVVEVHFPVPVEVDPSEWSPSQEVIRRMQAADLVLLNGAGYERWLQYASLPARITVDTSRSFQDRLLEVPDAIVHSHGGHAHSHAATAFTTWLDPRLLIEHGRAVKDALSKHRPERAGEFGERFAALADDFSALDREQAEAVRQNPDLPLIASHPVYHYLEARYGFNLRSVHWEPEEMPGATEWAAFDRLLSEHAAEWILWEDGPLPEIEERLRERGVRSVPFYPQAHPPEDGDLLTVMRENAARLREIFALQP